MKKSEPVLPQPHGKSKMEEQEEILTLVDRAKSGDQDAFEELWRHYQRPITTVVKVMLGYGNSSVPDVVQEISIKVWRSIRQFNGESKFSTWLYRIVEHTCIDYFRHEKPHKNDVPVDEANGLSNKPHWNIAVAVQLNAAEEVLMQMGDLEQRILRLVFWEEQPSKEVAATLRIKTQKVYDTVKNFRRRLKQKLKG